VGQEPVKKVCLPFVGVLWKYESELQLQRQLFGYLIEMVYVEDISVDAVLGCEFCCVVVIYDPNYNINNSNYSKLPLSPVSHSRYQLGSSSNTVMHIISVNMSALPHCQVRDKQEWSDNINYIILQFATLPTCNFLWEHFSAFNKTHRYIRQRHKKFTLWCFVYTKLSKAAILRQWNKETAGCWN